MNTCEICGSATSNQFTCSRSCAGKRTGKNKKGKPLTKRRDCKQCGVTVDSPGKIFCNRSCAASYNNSVKAKRWREFPACPACGKDVKRNKNTYCSTECSVRHRRAEYIRRWLAGEIDGNAGDCISIHVRRWLFAQRGEKCERCGWCEVNVHTGNIPVQVDHIDGNWKNNDPSNLRILCPSCHSLTSTYGGANKGNGRPYREIWRDKIRNGVGEGS